ncbi:NUDIX hydrolase [Andreprevotia chitinilytica]|uniref:NUDIX hydrolase n=1 Tax=Andreprevotia chitinilytica TaxID=396808 RepID=UPI00055220F3|nr:NUDIX domain-containing protein [Andreprevotia chitinilytica]
MPPIHVIALATLRNARLLTVRKRGTRLFMLPGGKPEVGETDVACLLREVKEELRCEVDPASLQFLGAFTAPAANEVGRLVVARVYRGDLLGEPALATEIEEMMWVDPAQPHVALAPLLQVHVLPTLLEQCVE